jgi:hypothetical protein
MSESPSEDQTGRSSETDHTGDGTYFEDVTEKWTDLEEQREELKMRQEALRLLDERVAKIDCDIGGASLEIDDDGIIEVSTSTPEMCEEVKQLVHGYSWPKKSAIGYDTRSECVTWSLKTGIETLVDDHQRLITE